MLIQNIQSLPDEILYGILNEKLRLECQGIHELASFYDLNTQDLLLRIESMDCYYSEDYNQLRSKS